MSTRPTPWLAVAIWLLGLVVCSAPAALNPHASSRPALGTVYGKERHLPIYYIAHRLRACTQPPAWGHPAPNDRAGGQALRTRG
ncbi:MAG: hypothetical protein RMK29_10075 [Myxococcales bacterium]|nr:hypothetical protein [Myxococcota bacterium]MDW8282049.1 hypothetical protein [Myxococcales bacterium]